MKDGGLGNEVCPSIWRNVRLRQEEGICELS